MIDLETPPAVALVGVRHWCDHLASLANRVDPDRSYVTIGISDLLLARWRFTRVVRVGFRPVALTPRGVAFDLTWALLTTRRARRTYWIGTDVWNTVTERKPGRFFRWVRRRLMGRSAAGAPWFVGELRECGVEATYVRFPLDTGPRVDPPSWPSAFSVAAYVPANKPEFYGTRTIVQLAELLPEVTFDVYGGGAVAAPPNLIRHGWTEDFRSALESSVVHLRPTTHDAIAGTVREALAAGRYVLFSHELPGVSKLDPDSLDDAVELMRLLLSQHTSGDLEPNDAGLAYADSMDWRGDAQEFVKWIWEP